MAAGDVTGTAEPAAASAPAPRVEPSVVPYHVVVDHTAPPRRRRRVDLGTVLAIAWLVVVFGGAVAADLLPLRDPLATNPGAGRQGPSTSFWLGTDQLGRDMLSRIFHGARTSLLVAFGATAASVLVGTVLGLLAGYYRRASETLIMSAMDVLLAFPALILAIALTSFLGASVRNLILAIAILALPAFARVARAQTLSYAERDFVKAARSIGARDSAIVFREIAPNIVPTMSAYALVIVAVAIVVEGSLSFLGLGVSSAIPTWGAMIAGGRPHLQGAPHISLVPSAVMFLTVLSFNSLGEKMRQRYEQIGGARG